MRGRIFPTVNVSTASNVSSYVQINIYDTTLEELHSKGVDIKQILQQSGCHSIIMDVPIIYTKLEKVTKTGRGRLKSCVGKSPALSAKKHQSKSSCVDIDASESHEEISCKSVVQNQSEEEFMDCRENVNAVSTGGGPLASTTVLSEHNNDFYDIGISAVVPNASFNEPSAKPLEPCVYADMENWRESLTVEREPHTNGVTVDEASISLYGAQRGAVPNTPVYSSVKGATEGLSHHAEILRNSLEPEDVGSRREAKVMGLPEASAGAAADGKVASSGTISGSSHVKSLFLGNIRKNPDYEEGDDSNKCSETQHTTKHATSRSKLFEKERAVQCQIPMCHKTLVYRRKYGKCRLLEHVRTHWERPVKKCKLCDFKASSARKVIYHHKNTHPNQPCLGVISTESKEDLDDLLKLWQQCFPGVQVAFAKSLLLSARGSC